MKVFLGATHHDDGHITMSFQEEDGLRIYDLGRPADIVRKCEGYDRLVECFASMKKAFEQNATLASIADCFMDIAKGERHAKDIKP